jgi:hypothetical protein
MIVMIWAPLRNREQGSLVAWMYQQARNVPCDRRAVVAGGLPGADKPGVLRAAAVDQSQYFTISIDRILWQMAARGMIPLAGGLAPMDVADLAHAEAQFLAKRAGLRAMADGRNLIWDISMASLSATQALLGTLRLAGYRVDALFADLTIEESVRRASAAHRRGHDEYLAGRGFGGRYIPPEAIRALALPPPARPAEAAAAGPAEAAAAGPAEAAVAGPAEAAAERASSAPAPARPSAAGNVPVDGGLLGSEVTGMIAAYRGGKISLEDLACYFRLRSWPAVPPACPPEMRDAAPAVDDPEPYVPGSFDDVVLAYDLGKLSDDEYRELAREAAATSRS